MAETSLTLLARLQQQSDPASWQRLVDLYAPLIGRWLSQSPLQSADHDDIAQEVLKVIVQKLRDFERRREGSFRTWLRVVTANCLKAHWRSEKYRPLATGDSDFCVKLQQLEDSQSALARRRKENVCLARRRFAAGTYRGAGFEPGAGAVSR